MLKTDIIEYFLLPSTTTLGFCKKYEYVSKLAESSRGRPEGFLFNSYYTEASGRALLHSLDCSTYP